MINFSIFAFIFITRLQNKKSKNNSRKRLICYLSLCFKEQQNMRKQNRGFAKAYLK